MSSFYYQQPNYFFYQPQAVSYGNFLNSYAMEPMVVPDIDSIFSTLPKD